MHLLFGLELEERPLFLCGVTAQSEVSNALFGPVLETKLEESEEFRDFLPLRLS